MIIFLSDTIQAVCIHGHNRKLYQSILINIICSIIVQIRNYFKPIAVIPQPAREKIIHGYFDGIFQRAGYSLVPQYTTSAKKSPTKKEKEKKTQVQSFSY